MLTFVALSNGRRGRSRGNKVRLEKIQRARQQEKEGNTETPQSDTEIKLVVKHLKEGTLKESRILTMTLHRKMKEDQEYNNTETYGIVRGAAQTGIATYQEL